MADQSVFEGNNPSGTPDTNTNPETILADQLKTIVNEDGNQKYDNVTKALEGLKNSQEYIPQLKTELSGAQAEISALKEQLAKTEAVEDVVSRLTQNQQAPTQKETPQVTGLDENAVVNLFNQLSAQQQQQATEAQNEAQVSNALSVKYGDKAAEVLNAKAAELGTTREALQEQARKNPQLVLAAFGQNNSQSGVTTSSVNIQPGIVDEEPLQAPEKSVLTGATTREQMDLMAKIRERVYKEHGITS